jgi:hypothetical protein
MLDAGRANDLHPGAVNGEVPQEAVQGEQGEGGGLRLEAGESTRDREKPAIHTAAVVQQIANGYL